MFLFFWPIGFLFFSFSLINFRGLKVQCVEHDRFLSSPPLFMKFILFSVSFWLRLCFLLFPLNFVCNTGVMIMNCLSLHLSQNIFMSFSVLKTALLVIEMLASSTCNMLFYAFLTFGMAGEDSTIIPISLPLQVSLPAFNIISLLCIFGTLTIIIIEKFSYGHIFWGNLSAFFLHFLGRYPSDFYSGIVLVTFLLL